MDPHATNTTRSVLINVLKHQQSILGYEVFWHMRYITPAGQL